MDVFEALAAPTRRQIIEMLASKGELSATDIYRRFDASPPAISQHLKILREAKLVRVERQGQLRIYQIDPDGMGETKCFSPRKRK
jgi:DNA-binding transcriptional ArsR family regulator